jgi:TRAP transporter TAXI family solute receptor
MEHRLASSTGRAFWRCPAALRPIALAAVVLSLALPQLAGATEILGGPPGSAADRFVRELAAAAHVRFPDLNLEPQTTLGGRDSLERLRTGPAKIALVRADLAREAYQGTGRFDVADPQLRTLAVLHSELVQVVVLPSGGIARLADLRGKRVAVEGSRVGTSDTLRRVLGLAGLGLGDVLVQLPGADPAADLAAGRIDAFATVGLPDQATITQALRSGARLVPVDPVLAHAVDKSAWPVQLQVLPAATFPGQVTPMQFIAIPVTLVTTAALPRGDAEDLVDALLAALPTLRRQVPAVGLVAPEMVAMPTPLPLHPGAAQAFERLGPLNGPIQVRVTLWVYEVGDIDMQQGTFRFDGALELRWMDARLTPTDVRPFEIMNAVEADVDAYGYDPKGAWHAMSWRIHAKLRADYDLRNYPFDRQLLSFQLEHPLLAKNRIQYQCETRFHPEGVDLRRDRLMEDFALRDWKLETVSSVERDVRYGPEETYSRYEFRIQMSRALLPFVVSELAPLLLMVLLGLAAGLIPGDKIDGKLLLTVLALLMAIELQVAHNERAPHIGYLTLTEWMYLVAYVSIAGSIVQSVFEYRLHAAQRDQDAARLRRWGFVLGALVFVVPLTVLLLVRS